MKAAGFVMFVLGLIMTVYTSFTYTTKEEVLDVGDVEVTHEKEHTTDWSPFLGVGVMIAGGSLLFVATKK